MSRINLILLLSVLLFTMSCKNQEDNELSNEKVLSEEQMVVVLADIHLTESYIDDLRRNGHQTKDSSMIYFEKVFKKHEITPVEFEESLLFYKKDLDNLNKIYTQVITRLNELKAKNEEMINQFKQDSIRLDSLRILQESDTIEPLTDSVNLLNDTIFVTDSVFIK